MKKTPNIHLVLVTALLTSCNPLLFRGQPPPDPVSDSSAVDTTYYNYPGVYFNFYFPGPPYAFEYAPASVYRRHAYWHNHVFVVRGGFGRAAASTAS